MKEATVSLTPAAICAQANTGRLVWAPSRLVWKSPDLGSSPYLSASRCRVYLYMGLVWDASSENKPTLLGVTVRVLTAGER